MKKIENLKYIQYVTNFNIVSSTLQKWIKLKHTTLNNIKKPF